MGDPGQDRGGDPRAVLRMAGGRDELNLAEFPITLLGDRVPDGCKTLVFEDTVFNRQAGETVARKLTVSGSDAYGLPTALDDEVLVALLQLTKLANGFTDPRVQFTRYELLKMLGWSDRGENYRRVEESLRRWLGVSLFYERAWWDKAAQGWVDANFHVLESVVVLGSARRRRPKAPGRRDLARSEFCWNQVIFRSFQAENLKRLDLDAYFGLKSAISKRMFRFLDKRFYQKRRWQFDLKAFAFEHVGLSRSYNVGQVKAKLRPALEELTAAGFLERMDPAERYAKSGPGDWTIVVARPSAAAESGVADPGPSGAAALLVARGVTAAVAADLARGFGADAVRAQVEAADWIKGRSPRKIADLGAYLVKAIREDFAPPAGFKAAIEHAAREAGRRGAEQAEGERRRVDRDEAGRREAALRSAWDALAEGDREAIRARVAAETPLLARHPRLLEAACLEAVASRGGEGDAAG